MSQKKRRSTGKIAGLILIGLLIAGGIGIFVAHSHNNQPSAKPVVGVGTSPSPTSTVTTQQVNLSYLEKALNSGTVTGQRQALATEIRASLQKPLFPVGESKRTTAQIKPATFKTDPDDRNLATVQVELSGSSLKLYEFRLIHEQNMWLIVSTIEVK